MADSTRPTTLQGDAICQSCSGPKACVHYLCRTCWPQLPEQARADLKVSPSIGEWLNRLSALRYQLLTGVPLGEIRIGSWWETYHAAKENTHA